VRVQAVLGATWVPDAPLSVPFPPHAAPQVLCDIVLENPNSAEAWFNFLDNEEACSRQGGCAPEHTGADAATTSGKVGGVGLYHLYHKATELVQRSKGRPLDAYVKIWVGYARHQW